MTVVVHIENTEDLDTPSAIIVREYEGGVADRNQIIIEPGESASVTAYQGKTIQINEHPTQVVADTVEEDVAPTESNVLADLGLDVVVAANDGEPNAFDPAD